MHSDEHPAGRSCVVRTGASLLLTLGLALGGLARPAQALIPIVAHGYRGILPAARDASANWRKAGLLSVGGIPTRATVCATVSPRGGGLDDTANIQSAINACP